MPVETPKANVDTRLNTKLKVEGIQPVLGPSLFRGRLLKDDTFKHFTPRSESFKATADALRAWLNAMTKATGLGFSRSDASSDAVFLALLTGPPDVATSGFSTNDFVLFMMGKMSVLFEGDKFEPTVSAKLLRRLASITPEIVQTWQADFKRVLRMEHVNEVFVAAVLLPIDSLYVQETLLLLSAQQSIGVACNNCPKPRWTDGPVRLIVTTGPSWMLR